MAVPHRPASCTQIPRNGIRHAMVGADRVSLSRVPSCWPLPAIDMPRERHASRECGCAGGGRGDLCRDRSVGPGGAAGGTTRGTRHEDVSAGAGAAGDDAEAGGWRTSARHPDVGQWGPDIPAEVGTETLL